MDLVFLAVFEFGTISLLNVSHYEQVFRTGPTITTYTDWMRLRTRSEFNSEVLKFLAVQHRSQHRHRCAYFESGREEG